MALDFNGDVQAGQNLDDNPVLPGLFEESKIQSSQIVEESAGAPPGDELTPQNAYPTQAGEVLEPEDGTSSRRQSGIDKRIAKITRRRHEAEEKNLALQSQLAAVTTQLAAVQGQLNQLQKPTVAPTTVQRGTVEGDDIYAGSGETPPAPAQPDVVGVVKAAIQEAVAPLYQKIAADSKRDETRAQHEASFMDVAEDYPDLAKHNSQLRAVFNDLFDNTPHLDALPDKPRIVATMARGLLADQRRGEQSSAARKRAAAVHTPTPAAADLESDVPGLSKTAGEAIEAAKKRVRESQADFQDYKLLRLAGMKQAAAQK
jgi:hypothetical protein